MSHDWRKELRKGPRAVAWDRMRKRRRRELSSDPVYVVGEDALKRRLKKHYAQNPEIVTDFFRLFAFPLATKLKSLDAFLRNVQETALRNTFREYFKFARRFRIVFILRRRSPHFETLEDLPNLTKFHVKIENGQLTPISPTDVNDSVKDLVSNRAAPRSLAKPVATVQVKECPVADDEPIEISFAAPQLEVPPPLDKAIGRGQAKFMRIDDKEGSWCLSILEHVAYFPEGMTFVLHNAEQPYLLCLIGEKVSVELWRKLSTTVTAMLRENYERGKAGRRKDLQKRARALKLLSEPGSLKSKAIDLEGDGKRLKTNTSYLSRIRKEQQE